MVQNGYKTTYEWGYGILEPNTPLTLSSDTPLTIVGIVGLVVHDQDVVHEIERVRSGLVRTLDHLVH